VDHKRGFFAPSPPTIAQAAIPRLGDAFSLRYAAAWMRSSEELDAIRRRVNAGFPVEFSTHTLACWDPPYFMPKMGWVAELSFFDKDTYRGPRVDVIVAGPDLSDVDEAPRRLVEAIQRLQQTDPNTIADGDQLAEIVGLPVATYDPEAFLPTDEDVQRRLDALARMEARFDGVARRFAEVYGLRLPRHLAVFAAFWRSLSEAEQRGVEALGRSPGGITQWFDDGALERKTREGLDPRLDCRFRCDPPELVTIMWGDSDGLHHGLWFDDPAELPTCVAGNYARDSAETWGDEHVTALQLLEDDLESWLNDRDYDGEPVRGSVLALQSALAWWRNHDDAALVADGTTSRPDVERPEILGGMGPALPPDSGDPRGGYENVQARHEAYRGDRSAVGRLAMIARTELAEGKPAFALVVGRELHWMDDDATRELGLELLTRAYEALGRDALADIARVHHENRDLRSVTVFD
jgi:hypothetical protein